MIEVSCKYCNYTFEISLNATNMYHHRLALQHKKPINTFAHNCFRECEKRYLELFCESCENIFEVNVSNVKDARFCSLNCEKREVIVNCGWCNKTFKIKAKDKLGIVYFCSANCKNNDNAYTEKMRKFFNVKLSKYLSKSDEYVVQDSKYKKFRIKNEKRHQQIIEEVIRSIAYEIRFDRQVTISCYNGDYKKVEREFQRRYEEMEERFLEYYKRAIYRELDSKHNKKFERNRLRALKRDGYKCIVCGITNEEYKKVSPNERGLDGAHLVHNSYRGKNDSVGNLITLCYFCHSIFDERVTTEKMDELDKDYYNGRLKELLPIFEELRNKTKEKKKRTTIDLWL